MFEKELCFELKEKFLKCIKSNKEHNCKKYYDEFIKCWYSTSKK